MKEATTAEIMQLYCNLETDSLNNTYCDCPGFLDNRGAEINIADSLGIESSITSKAVGE